MDKPPEILWHYTTFETLAKILDTQCILATDHRFLNDSMEIKTGLERLELWRNSRPNTTQDGAQNMELVTWFKDRRIGA